MFLAASEVIFLSTLFRKILARRKSCHVQYKRAEKHLIQRPLSYIV